MIIPAMHEGYIQLIHLLIELYGNWGEDSETKWRYKSETKPKNKIGGTKTKSSCSIFLKRYTCCTSEPHPLPAWRSYGSYIWWLQPAIQGECSTVVIRFLMKLYRNWGRREWEWVQVSERNKTKHKSGGPKGNSNWSSFSTVHMNPPIPGEVMIHNWKQFNICDFISVQSMIHFLIELYGNWGGNSETKWRYKWNKT